MIMKNILNDLSQEEKKNILNQHKGGKKFFVENFNKLVNNKLGTINPLLVEQQQQPQQTKTITTKVATEGLKNITPQMISSPPFAGYYSGYVISGKFGDINYSWDLTGVEGMSGIRGSEDGEIETENNSFLAGHFPITDANPNGSWVGFRGGSFYFVCYQTTDNKIKCVNV